MGISRGNSFDFLRFCAAAGVLVGHQFIMSGGARPWGIENQHLAEIPLHIFFSLSGFLIYQSLERSDDGPSFLSARISRIVPTLIVSLVLASAITLFYFANYAHSIDHIKYVYRNVFFPFRVISDFIPGVFENSPLHEVNAPLWTLAYEVWLYIILFLIFKATSSRTLTIVVLLIFFNILWSHFGVNDSRIPFTPIFPMRIGKLGCYFFSGALIAAYWDKLRNRPPLLLATSAVALVVTTMLAPLTAFDSLALSACVIGLGSLRLFSAFSLGGDPSYGMYVFAWPIQQFSVLLMPDFRSSLLFAFLLSAITGYSTFHLYERRCIGGRKQLASLIRRIFCSAAPRSLRSSQPTPDC